MSGLTSAMDAAKTSIFTNQKSIEITGNNIANINTPGYSRQRPELTPYPALNFNGYFIGQGVKLSTVTREHDVFLTRQLREQNASFGEESAQASPLAEIERVFNISEENLSTEIDRFFDAWQELSANPSGSIERDVVVQRGNILANKFHSTSQELENVRQNINFTISSKIDEINLKLQEVAELNVQIGSIEMAGQPANTFRDRRDLLLEELSYSLGIQSYEENNHMVSVQLPSGLPLVESAKALPINGVISGNNVQLQIQYDNTTLDVGMGMLGGEFKGLLTVRDSLLPSIKDDLDKLAYNLTNEINTQHQAGVGLDGIGGRDFFTTLAVQTNASDNIAVMVNNSSHIAAGTSSAPGDNTNAIAISGLSTANTVNGTDTFVSFYGDITARVGIESSQNRLSLGGSEDALVQLQNLRDGKVGVSLEEEMINLIQFQRGFEASAKVLSTVDEMMATLLTIKR